MANVHAEILEIIQTISQVRDAALIAKIRALLQEAQDNEIVGSKTDGTPMTRKMLFESIDESEKAYREGRVYTTEEIREHFRKQSADD